MAESKKSEKSEKKSVEAPKFDVEDKVQERLNRVYEQRAQRDKG